MSSSYPRAHLTVEWLTGERSTISGTPVGGAIIVDDVRSNSENDPILPTLVGLAQHGLFSIDGTFFGAIADFLSEVAEEGPVKLTFELQVAENYGIAVVGIPDGTSGAVRLTGHQITGTPKDEAQAQVWSKVDADLAMLATDRNCYIDGNVFEGFNRIVETLCLKARALQAMRA